jgi:hypothetical protein
MAKEKPNYNLLLTAMIIWTTVWIDELMLASCDGNCVSSNLGRLSHSDL